MAANTLSFSLFSLACSQSLNTKRNKASSSIPSTSMYGNQFLNLTRSNSSCFVLKYRSSATATVSLSLPTVNPEGAPSEKLPNWSARAIKAFAMAELEARKIKYPNTGTEALLMGILVEGTSTTSKFLRDNGITLSKVREEIIDFLGKSDLYYFSPEHPPLTEQAQKVLDGAVDEKLKSGEGGEITTTHFLLGIWAEKESAGHKVLATLGFNDEKAKELTKSMNRDAVQRFK